MIFTYFIFKVFNFFILGVLLREIYLKLFFLYANWIRNIECPIMFENIITITHERIG